MLKPNQQLPPFTLVLCGVQAVSGVAWLPHRPLPTFTTCGGDGLLLWVLTPTFLEQRQLDIPDIALAVSAAAAAAGTVGAAGCRIIAVCTAASSGSWAVDSLAGAPPPSAAAAAGSGGDTGTPGDPFQQKQLREAAAATVFAADSTGGIWQLAIGEGGGGRRGGVVGKGLQPCSGLD